MRLFPQQWGRQKPPPGIRLNSGHGLANGLIGRWLFNEGGGLWVNDLAGNNGGVLTNGPTWAAGRFGPALQFDSVDALVTISFTRITGYPFTLSVWTQATAGANGSPPRALTLGKGATQYFSIGWTGTGGQPVLAGRNAVFDAITATTIGLNIWTYLVGVFRSATDRELFVNGKSGATDTSSVTELTDATTIQIGSAFTGSLSGTVEDARVYNRALLPSEIWQLYVAPFADMAISSPVLQYGAATAAFNPSTGFPWMQQPPFVPAKTEIVSYG